MFSPSRVGGDNLLILLKRAGSICRTVERSIDKHPRDGARSCSNDRVSLVWYVFLSLFRFMIYLMSEVDIGVFVKTKLGYYHLNFLMLNQQFIFCFVFCYCSCKIYYEVETKFMIRR